MVLVTGGSGAVGINCILQLLQRGYSVRTTLRSLSKQKDIKEMLLNGGISDFEKLSCIEADLTSDKNWSDAMKDCQYVLHVASPTHIESADEQSMIGPAVDGVLRVLKAARAAKVQRVVLTSSFGALGFSNKDKSSVTTEANWTNPGEKGLSAYEKSKTLAERAAWDFTEKNPGSPELVTINPVAIFGPSLGPGNSPSLGLIKGLLSGKMKAIPNIPLNVVDIRDVAALHLLAMETPAAKGQRFIATADGEISLPEVAELLKKKFPAVADKLPSKTIPDWVLRIAALFNPQAKHAASLLKINRNVSNDKAKRILGWKPIADQQECILAAAESLIKFKMV